MVAKLLELARGEDRDPSLFPEVDIEEETNLFIKSEARVCWLIDSLQGEEGRVPPRVVEQFALWYPKLLKDYIAHYEEQPLAEAAFVQAFQYYLWVSTLLRTLGWFQTIFSLAEKDVRHCKIYSYLYDHDRQPMDPHPSFEDWFDSALLCPFPDDSPSYSNDLGRERNRFVIQFKLDVPFRTSMWGDDSPDFQPKIGPPPTRDTDTEEAGAQVLPPKPALELVFDEPSRRKERVREFLVKVNQETSEELFSNQDFARVAGYRTTDGFYDWRRGRTVSDPNSFERVLGMKPEEFIRIALRKRPNP